jgi:hypothetical protein
MPTFEGFIAQSPDGGTRIHLREDAHRFVDVDRGAVVNAAPVDDAEPDSPFEVVRVEVADDARPREGRLEPHELDACFEATPDDLSRPASKSPDCETAYKRCYSIQIC